MENNKLDYLQTSIEIEYLEGTLGNFSSHSTFDSDTWLLDKLKKAANIRDGNISLYFSKINRMYVWHTKFFILQSLHKGKSFGLLNTNLYGLQKFFEFIVINYGAIPLKDFNKNIITEFEFYLHDNDSFSKSTKETIWSALNVFFKTMGQVDGMPKQKITSNMNPFSRTSADRLLKQKYVPLKIINQIDHVFKNEDMPHHIRTIYWICRLIPSRINEVTTIPIDALKKYRENEYTLTLNMYKQNGGYMRPEPRIIHLKNEDMGEYLIELIKHQQTIAEALQSNLDTSEQGYLFTYSNTFHNKIHLLTDITVREKFNELMFAHDIVDEENQIYQLTPHQLRHNAITDRIYEGFSLLEIRDMTAHKSNTMLEGSYIHPEKNEIKELAKKINPNQEPAGGVLFQGKIINADNPTIVKRILSKPRAHKIGRLGICSDITGCKNDMFECFSCPFFVPNADELDHFKEQVTQWEKKVEMSKNSPLMKENAEYNLKLSQGIVKKIEESIQGGEVIE